MQSGFYKIKDKIRTRDQKQNDIKRIKTGKYIVPIQDRDKKEREEVRNARIICTTLSTGAGKLVD